MNSQPSIATYRAEAERTYAKARRAKDLRWIAVIRRQGVFQSRKLIKTVILARHQRAWLGYQCRFDD